jgi:hypothetical protein
MPAKIYFDTNVLLYFADAFRNRPVDVDLKEHFVVSPISILELLAEIGTEQAEEAFRTVKAFPNIFDTDKPMPCSRGNVKFSGSLFSTKRLKKTSLPNFSAMQ